MAGCTSIFQPHRYTRTRDLMGEFAAAFHGRRFGRGARYLSRRMRSRLLAVTGQRAGRRDCWGEYAMRAGERGVRGWWVGSKAGDLVITQGAGTVSRRLRRCCWRDVVR